MQEICHNLEWKLGQNEKYANTKHVWPQKSLEISFAFSKWEEVEKVLTTHDRYDPGIQLDGK